MASCTPDVTLSSDGAGQSVTGTAVDNAGNTATDTVSGINIDKTLPTITAAVTPAKAASGWWNIATGAPTVTYTCHDSLSLITSCASPFVFPEGEDQEHTGKAVDKADNENTATLSGIDLDLTAPGVIWTGGPADGSSHYFGSVPAAPTCIATDALSGANGCSVSGYSTAVGQHTLTATAYDVAGNKTEETRSYTVRAWTLTGFYRPVDMGALNTVKAGSTVPLKFEVFAGETEFTSTAVVMSFTTQKVACTGGLPEDAVEVTTTGKTELRYDFVDGQFIQNWQTPKQPSACYIVTMTTQDGSTLKANFKLK